MTSPRLEIHLDRIRHNTQTLVERLAPKGISVTGVTKATLGSPEIARELLRAGVKSIGESRIENIEKLRDAGIESEMILIRSPLIGQIDRVVAAADASLNTEVTVLEMLSLAARKQSRTHGVILMVEFGDLREGILPVDLESMVRKVLRLPHITLLGIGTNLACQSGVAPSRKKMDELSSLADMAGSIGNKPIAVISGGNSANLGDALNDTKVSKINNLRLGESLYLGRETLDRRPIDGLYTDAITLVAEVIESKNKPAKPWGEIHQSAFESTIPPSLLDSPVRTILAMGRQDVDPTGLGLPPGYSLLGASSDHLILGSSEVLDIGTEMRFQLNYGALLRAMTSPYVSREFIRGDKPQELNSIEVNTDSRRFLRGRNTGSRSADLAIFP